MLFALVRRKILFNNKRKSFENKNYRFPKIQDKHENTKSINDELIHISQNYPT
jgi:hypothetical protein